MCKLFYGFSEPSFYNRFPWFILPLRHRTTHIWVVPHS
jgi:hypothetical protein